MQTTHIQVLVSSQTHQEQFHLPNQNRSLVPFFSIQSNKVIQHIKLTRTNFTPLPMQCSIFCKSNLFTQNRRYISLNKNVWKSSVFINIVDQRVGNVSLQVGVWPRGTFCKGWQLVMCRSSDERLDHITKPGNHC